MEWNKVDKKWGAQLEEREIKPSAQAWDKLSAGLDQHTEKKDKPVILWWVGIAASLVVGGFTVMQLMTSTAVQDVPSVVLPTMDEVESVVFEKESVLPETVLDTEEEVQQEYIHVERSATIEIANQESIESIKTFTVTVDTISTLKPEHLQEVFIEPVMNKSSKKIVVSSEDLLNQVEGEIEIEYRETVIKRIYDKTKKVIVEISK